MHPISLKRRDILKTGAAATAIACVPALATTSAMAQTPAGSPEDIRLNAMFDAFMADDLDHSPESVTALGLDNGARAAAKAKLDDRSLGAIEDNIRRTHKRRAELQAVDRSKLTGLNISNYDSVLFSTAVSDDLNALPYIGEPYAVSQLTGAYQSVPDFLDSQHAIEGSADAESYLSRLAAFATAVDQESEQVRHDVGLGVIPPDFIIAKTLTQMKALRDGAPDKANLVQSLVRRAKDKGLAGDWDARATKIYTNVVQPALTRQIALFEDLAPKAVHDAGVKRLPHGEELYALSLKSYTTSLMPPAEIHKTGLDLIASQTAEMNTIFAAQGMTKGTVGERLKALYADPKYRYPNTDEGKEQLIAHLNTLVEKVQARLPEYFGTLPKAKLAIRRVPKVIEAGAPGGYYQSGTLDGKRPGAYYINLRDTAEMPSWTLPTLTFHEGIPGHHLQGSLAMETSLPMIRKTQFFSGYGEGWALYAEQMAVEMGMYADDPMGHIGQLHDAMFRSVRLVVDSGMHHMGWSREKAIAFMVDTLGDPETAATTEIERYCVWPGQACSYMLGKLEWLRLRAHAKAEMGARFDIRKFHDAGLLAGAMPLPALANRIEAYIKG